jgi:Protein of unknown function (DUF2934)
VLGGVAARAGAAHGRWAEQRDNQEEPPGRPAGAGPGKEQIMSTATSRPIAVSNRLHARGNGAAGPSDRSTPFAPRVARVRRRAFELFEQRAKNGGKGDALSDWLAAEREVNGQARLAEAKSRARGETLLHDED